MKVSVIGAGTMGTGIVQIAATNGHEVCLYDSFDGAIETAKSKLKKILDRLVEKERITQQENEAILGRINFTNKLKDIADSELVIEAIIELAKKAAKDPWILDEQEDEVKDLPSKISTDFKEKFASE